MKQKENFLKAKKTIVGFAIAAVMGGFFFLNKGVTGNAILSTKQPFSIINLIGLILIACAFILGAYAIKKK